MSTSFQYLSFSLLSPGSSIVWLLRSLLRVLRGDWTSAGPIDIDRKDKLTRSTLTRWSAHMSMRLELSISEICISTFSECLFSLHLLRSISLVLYKDLKAHLVNQPKGVDCSGQESKDCQTLYISQSAWQWSQSCIGMESTTYDIDE
jgi:hypothetical protein